MDSNNGTAIADLIKPYLIDVVLILLVIAIIVLIVVLVRVSKTMKNVNTLVEDANKQVAPALENVNTIITDVQPMVKKVDPLVDRVGLTVDTVNLELLRVDGILEDVEQVTDVASGAATTVANITQAPTEAVANLIDKAKNVLGGADEAAAESKKRFVYPVGKAENKE